MNRKNKTLGLLDFQYWDEILTQDRIKDINSIAGAKGLDCSAVKSIGMDAFMLGYIYGKRAERARRKKWDASGGKENEK